MSGSLASRSLSSGTAALLGVLGVIFGIGPAVLLIWAGLFAGTGYLTAVTVFGIPVIVCTLVAILISVVLIRGEQRRWGMIVGWVALVVGVVSYVIWGYVLSLGLTFGDGPV